MILEMTGELRRVKRTELREVCCFLLRANSGKGGCELFQDDQVIDDILRFETSSHGDGCAGRACTKGRYDG